jgi:hypothetical protein
MFDVFSEMPEKVIEAKMFLSFIKYHVIKAYGARSIA